MGPEQAIELGQLIRARREQLGLSVRQLADQAEMNFATISRLEQGQFGSPRADKLARLAAALDLNVADLYGLAEYTVPSQLPSFQPYLRSKYRDMPPEALRDLDKAFERIIKKHGYRPNGPAPGEDET